MGVKPQKNVVTKNMKVREMEKEKIDTRFALRLLEALKKGEISRESFEKLAEEYNKEIRALLKKR